VCLLSSITYARADVSQNGTRALLVGGPVTSVETVGVLPDVGATVTIGDTDGEVVGTGVVTVGDSVVIAATGEEVGIEVGSGVRTVGEFVVGAGVSVKDGGRVTIIGVGGMIGDSVGCDVSSMGMSVGTSDGGGVIGDDVLIGGTGGTVG